MNVDLQVKAVLFDLVGTLIYVRDSVGTVYSNVAKSFGFNINPLELDKSFLNAIHEIAQPVGGEEEEKKWWKKIVCKTFKSTGYDLKDKLDEIFFILYKEFSQKNTWAIYPEVFSVLERLKKNKIKTGLISNFDSRLEVILRQLNIYKYFDSLSYSGRVGSSKPDPLIFKFAIKELNIIPEEAIYIGDSLYNDYYPACKLNINAFLLDRNNECQETGIKKITSLNQIFGNLNLI